MRFVRVSLSAGIIVPHVPSFLRTEVGGLIPIEALTEDELRHLGRAWVANLLEQATERRRNHQPPSTVPPAADAGRSPVAPASGKES